MPPQSTRTTLDYLLGKALQHFWSRRQSELGESYLVGTAATDAVNAFFELIDGRVPTISALHAELQAADPTLVKRNDSTQAITIAYIETQLLADPVVAEENRQRRR